MNVKEKTMKEKTMKCRFVATFGAVAAAFACAAAPVQIVKGGKIGRAHV